MFQVPQKQCKVRQTLRACATWHLKRTQYGVRHLAGSPPTRSHWMFLKVRQFFFFFHPRQVFACVLVVIHCVGYGWDWINFVWGVARKYQSFLMNFNYEPKLPRIFFDSRAELKQWDWLLSMFSLSSRWSRQEIEVTAYYNIPVSMK